MGMLLALVVGYVIGARAGSRDLEQLVESLRVLRESDEFADLAAAARSHLGHTLRELANMVDGDGHAPVETGDLVDRVMRLSGRD